MLGQMPILLRVMCTMLGWRVIKRSILILVLRMMTEVLGVLLDMLVIVVMLWMTTVLLMDSLSLANFFPIMHHFLLCFLIVLLDAADR